MAAGAGAVEVVEIETTTTGDQVKVEIERRFLVVSLPRRSDIRSIQIRQGYLSFDEVHKTSVRVRQADKTFTLTAKGPVDDLGMVARNEGEVEISPEQFEVLWPLTLVGRIAKTRFLVPWVSFTFEVDYFYEHKGLMIVEVEFDSIEASEAFAPPSWFGREITNDPRFTNAWIARYGNPLLQAKTTNG